VDAQPRVTGDIADAQLVFESGHDSDGST
jgi:hypothetical protein